jgi:hypothetical protein
MHFIKLRPVSASPSAWAGAANNDGDWKRREQEPDGRLRGRFAAPTLRIEPIYAAEPVHDRDGTAAPT